MASYLDNIPTFNEYVEQRPQDEMLKVGLFKQQRYEEGIQKIQNSIDNIAGLDLIRPVDKDYLQSKLNALGGQLQSIAASDFSNFQLVNTVDGMTKQLVNDPVILNAVASTSYYRKQLGNQEKINTDGKGSKSNDWYFNQQVNNWLGSDLDARFTAQYTPYVDYNEQAREIVKGLVKTEQIRDVAFGTDEKGRPYIMDAMTRKKVEGVDAERIQTALLQGLSPDARFQMQVDGLYNYSNVSPEQFASDLNNDYSAVFDGLVKERQRLEGAKEMANDADMKMKIQGQIDVLNSQTKYLQAQYDDISAGFTSGDVENAKAKLYTTNWFNDFSNAYATKNISETYLTNPWFTADMQKKKMIQDQQEFIANYEQRERHHRETYNQKEREIASQNWSFPVGVSDFEEKDDDEVAAIYKSTLAKEKKKLEEMQKRMEAKYGSEGFKIGEVFDQSNPLFNRADFKEEYAELQLLQTQYDSATASYANLMAEANLVYPQDRLDNGEANPDFLKKHFNPKYNSNNLLLSGTTLDGDVIQVRRLSELAAAFDYFDENYLTDEGGGYVQDPQLPYANWVPGDQVPVTGENYGTYPSDLPDSMRFAYDLWSTGIQDSLSSFDFYDSFTDAYGSVYRGDDFETKHNQVRGFKRTYDAVAKSEQKKRQKYIADGIKKISTLNQSMQYTVPLEKPAQVADMKSKLLTLQSEMERGGLKEVDNFANLIDGLDAANIITDGENDFRLVVRGGGLGGKQYDAEIDLTKSQFDMLFPGGQYYPSTAIQTFNANFLDQMLRTRPKLEANYPNDPVTGLPDYEAAPTWLPDPQTYWTTATDGQYKTTAANAGIVNSQFPNVQLYGISGNLVSAQNPKNTNQFRLFLNITDPTKPGEIFENILLNPPGSMTGGIIDKSKVAFTISQLNDKFIYEMMNPGKQFTREVQMELINAAKNPQQ